MKKSIIDIDYFKELEEQILDVSKWKSDKFNVYDHEAGTGKSRFTQKCIGEMTKTRKHKVLYVQKFKKDNELINTVDRINKYADREVAGYYCSEIKRRKRKQLQQVQVLCVTHQLYYQICKGNNLELVKDRDILIIDEWPQLVKEVYVTRGDIGKFWTTFNRAGGDAGKELAQILLDMLLEREENKDSSIQYIDFALDKYRDLRALLARIKDTKDTFTKDEKKLFEKFNILLNQGFFISQNKFISYEKGVELYKLRNNIILDANGSFDYRYLLSSQFEIKSQLKQFDYRNTEILHYIVNTTKGNLKKIRDKYYTAVLSKIDWEDTNKILFVTDKDNEQHLEKEIVKHLKIYGNTLEKIEKSYSKKISIDHFGNLIGKNNYREYESVVLLKTPNYSYNSYILEYFSLMGNPVDGTRIEPFQNKDIEKLRISILSGEFYQAIKRINRENKLSSKIYLFTDATDSIEIVKKQLKNIRYSAIEMEIKGEYNTNNRPKNQLNNLKKILIRYKNKGAKEVNKKSIREELSIEAPNLSKLLKEVKSFAKDNNIIIDSGRKILFI